LCGVEINKKNREDLDPYEGDGKFSKLNRFKCLDCNTEYRATAASSKLKTNISIISIFFSSLVPVVIPSIINYLNITTKITHIKNIMIFSIFIIGLIQIFVLKSIVKFEIVNRSTYQRTYI